MNSEKHASHEESRADVLNASAPRYIDKNSLARTFCVSPRTICRWVADGMPALRLPTRSAKNPRAGTLRFRLSEVERWLEAQNEVAKR